MLIFGRKPGEAFTIFEDLSGIISYGSEIEVELTKIEGTKHTLRVRKEYAEYYQLTREDFTVTVEQEDELTLTLGRDSITIKVLDPKRGSARLGITAPNKFKIFRNEISY